MAYRAKVYLAIASFAAFNIVLMLCYAKSMLGPTPAGLIITFFLISVLGALLMAPFYFMTRGWGLSRIDLVILETMWIGLGWFNGWLIMAYIAVV